MREDIKRYNDLGWVVMPIKANSKIPMISGWSKIQSNDETIERFKDDSNVGVLMGKVSGIMCIDVDVKKCDGVATLNNLEQLYGELPDTVMSETPSGGIHYYFKYHEGIRNRKKVGEGIDIQADGTQTLEYPSVTDDGSYEWIYDPWQYEIAELPQTWLDFLCETSNDGVALSSLPFEAPVEVQEGSRNNTIASYVGSMLGKKLKKKTVLNKALKYNEEACDPPLDEDEVEQIVESMIKTDIHNKAELVVEAIKHDENEKIEEISWLSFDETGTPNINELKFAEWYVEENQIYCVNGKFFTKHGSKADAWFKSDIQRIIGPIIPSKLGTKVKDLIEVVKNCCYTEVDTPDPFKIQFENVSFDVQDGTLKECDEFFTLHQIPHEYDAKAKCPRWEQFINELFYEEDIPVIQEYLGYCLVPNTLAQTSLFVIGEGGEGKSRITIMMDHILGGDSVVVGDFKGLQDRFSMSSLDNQMLFIDDDLSSDALDDTSNFKKIVTAETKMEVETKGQPKYKTLLYSKLLCMGNNPVTSKFDHTDGFYRRLLVSRVKPLTSKRVPDRTLKLKLEAETQGIINWMLEGLLRVVKNGFVIKPSTRMEEQLRDVRDNVDTISQFFNDEQYIHYTYDPKDVVSTKDLYSAYETWCQDNAQLCLQVSTFNKRFKAAHKNYIVINKPDITLPELNELTSKERMYINKKQVRGLCGIELKNYSHSFTIKK